MSAVQSVYLRGDVGGEFGRCLVPVLDFGIGVAKGAEVLGCLRCPECALRVSGEGFEGRVKGVVEFGVGCYGERKGAGDFGIRSEKAVWVLGGREHGLIEGGYAVDVAVVEPAGC